nr:hypothetical protein [Tanacetum cinerariifolium]
YAHTPIDVSLRDSQKDYILTDGDEEDGCVHVHPGQGGDDSAASKEKLTTDENVRNESEDHKYQVSDATVSSIDDLEICVAT